MRKQCTPNVRPRPSQGFNSSDARLRVVELTDAGRIFVQEARFALSHRSGPCISLVLHKRFR